MKKLLLFSLLFLSLFTGKILPAQENWKPGPDSRWFVKLEPALAQAEKEGKFVYVLNTGSDWCGFCKDLAKEVLSQEYFAELAQKHLVLVYLDQPSKKVDMPQDQRDYNRAIVRKLRFPGGVPTALLLTSSGERIDVLNGYSPQAIYISDIYKKLDLPGAPKFPARVEIKLRSKRKHDEKKATVEITEWCTAENNKFRPFSASDMISIPPGKKIFFKVVYTLPPDFKAILHLSDIEKNKLRSHSGLITQSGTYIFSTSAPTAIGNWGYRTAALMATVEPRNNSYRSNYEPIPSRIKLDPELLNEQEKINFNNKIKKTRDKFANSRFEIISWGKDLKNQTPYNPAEGIKTTSGAIYIKFRYTLPGAAVIGISNRQYCYMGYTPRPVSGEYTCRLFCYNNSSKLYVSLRPRKGELLKNIITIPCDITVTKKR